MNFSFNPFRFIRRDAAAARKAASSSNGAYPSSMGSMGTASLHGSGYWGSSDTAHSGPGGASETLAAADLTAHPDLLASLWDSKWFGCCEEVPSDTSLTNGSHRSTNSHSGASTAARAAAALSSPIMFSSKTDGDLPHVTVTRMLNTPLPPGGALPRSDSLGMGTWTKRQTTFLEDSADTIMAETSGRETTPGSIVATWLREQAAQKTAESNIMQSEDAVEGAAWRWRFARRWHAEQMRDIDPATASQDRAEEAQLLQGNAWNLQHAHCSSVGRASSSDLGSSLVKTGSIVGVDVLLFDSDGGWAANRPGSTQRQQQQREERERKAQKLWQDSSSTLLPTVEVDSWGTFRFIVVKLSGLDAQDRCIVNGRNHCTDASLIENVHRKVMLLSEVQPQTLLVIGGGIMEWRRDRDHCLHLHSGYCSDTSQKIAAKPADLLNLAAKLVRENLPSGYTVVTSDA